MLSRLVLLVLFFFFFAIAFFLGQNFALVFAALKPSPLFERFLFFFCISVRGTFFKGISFIFFDDL